MMVVTSHLLAAYRSEALTSFFDEMVDHCYETFPEHCEGLTDAELRAAVREAMRRATRQGMLLRGSVRLYVELCLMFGSAFADDPQYPWAAELLHGEEELSERDRADELYARVCEHLEAVEEDGAERLQAALRHLDAENGDGGAADGCGADQHVSDGELASEGGQAERIAALLRRAAPLKADYAGEEALRRVVGAAAVKLQTAGLAITGIVGDRAVATLALLIFFLGHGCERDGFHPRVEKTLSRCDRDTQATLPLEMERQVDKWLLG